MRNPWVLAVVGFGLVGAALIMGWLVVDYRRGAHPPLVLVLPIEKCPSLRFSDKDGFIIGPRVDVVCGNNGLANGPFFAYRGKKVVRVVMAGRAEYDHIETEDGDHDMVYFYRYRERDSPLVGIP